jgi:hypothetical protein
VEVSLGQIPAYSGEARSIEFVLQNGGTAPLLVTELSTSCDCALPKLSASSLEPGARATISVELRTELVGYRRAEILITSNATNEPSKRVAVSWEGKSALEAAPEEVDFGVLGRGEAAERRILIKVFSFESVGQCQVEAVTTSPEYLIEAAWTNTYAANDFERELTVRFKGSQYKGSSEGTVQIRLAKCGQKLFYVPVRWEVRDEIECSPPSLYLGNMAPSESTEFTINLVRAGKNEFTVSAVESEGDHQPVEFSESPSEPGATSLKLRLRAPEKGGPWSRKLVIKCGELSCQLSVAGFVNSRLSQVPIEEGPRCFGGPP